MGDKTTAKCFMVLAIILAPIEIVFLAVPFATDHWLEFVVDRAELKTTDLALYNTADLVQGMSSHTRYNGLFKVCFPGNDTSCKYQYCFCGSFSFLLQLPGCPGPHPTKIKMADLRLRYRI